MVPDLNLPPSETWDQEGTLVHDVDVWFVGTVIIAPSTSAVESTSQRNHENTILADIGSDDRRLPAGLTATDYDHVDYCLDRICDSICWDHFLSNSAPDRNFYWVNLQSMESSPSPLPPQQPPSPATEPKFNCPVCMGPLVEATTTKCGHIFCKSCISAAIAAQGRCPNCRTNVTGDDTIRVYLPDIC